MATWTEHVLRCKRTLKPEGVEDLTPLQQRQLVVAGKLYDGAEHSAAERLSYEGSDAHPDGQRQSFKGFVEIRELVDSEGTPAFDAYLYMVDSGTIFRTGTTDVVAEVIQCGVECDDPALEQALEAVLDAEPPDAVPSTKKTASAAPPPARQNRARKPMKKAAPRNRARKQADRVERQPKKKAAPKKAAPKKAAPKKAAPKKKASPKKKAAAKKRR